MLHLLTKLFRKSKPSTPVRAKVVAAANNAAVAPLAVPRVEIASLSLLAILQRFPADLKSEIARMPDAEAMIALPVPSIAKQLPSGSVKMSLASIYRQAPAGTFAHTRFEEKRMVEVPLNEIFKRVKPELLKRRADQRQHELAEDGIDVFGDKDNPYAIAPTSGEPPRRRAAFTPAPESSGDEADIHAEPSPEPILKMQTPVAPSSPPAGTPSFRAGSDGMRLSTPSPSDPSAEAASRPSNFSPSLHPAQGASSIAPSPGLRMPSLENGSQGGAPAKPQRSSFNAPDGRTTSANLADAPPLVIPLKDVIAKWPESIVAELGPIEGATITLPAAEVGSGLAKGKVAFTWGELRAWIQPAREGDTTNPTDIELSLPLRLLAPAFLHSSKQQKERRTLSIDDSIPALFSGGPSAKVAPTPATPPPLLPVTAPEPQPIVPEPSDTESDDVSAIETEEIASDAETLRATVDAPFTSPEPTVESIAEREESETPAPAIVPAAIAAEEPVVEPSLQPAAVAAEAQTISAAPPSASTILADDKAPNSLGEVFGQPGKASWAPGEIVQEVVKLPQIAGAIVALSEGLVVAHRLPEGMKGEVVAAFLPQIFGRLNQYCTEMKVGEIDEILLSSGGAYFQAFHSGQIFFAVLGKQGESLPWHALRLMAEELLQQTKK
jgi:predicted regulator of Ras-like GTPase activity (Roadblock/LC7/MglB family)